MQNPNNQDSKVVVCNLFVKYPHTYILHVSISYFSFIIILKKCCSGKSIFLSTRTFSSLQHVFDRKRSLPLGKL